LFAAPPRATAAAKRVGMDHAEPDAHHRSPMWSGSHRLMKRPDRGTTRVMVTLALGLLVSAGIVTGLVLDWVRHPDL